MQNKNREQGKKKHIRVTKNSSRLCITNFKPQV